MNDENSIVTRKTEAIQPPSVVTSGIIKLFRPINTVRRGLWRGLWNRPVLFALGALGWILYLALNHAKHVALPGLFLLCMLLGSCGWGLPTPRPPVVEKPDLHSIITEPTNGTAIEKADWKVSQLEGQLAAARSEADLERQHANEARINGLKTLITWLSAALLLIAVVAAVAAFWLGMLKTLGTLSLACIGGIVVAQTTSILLNHLVIAACVVGGVALVAAALILWKHRQTWLGLLASVEIVEENKPDKTTELPSEKLRRRTRTANTINSVGGKAALAGIQSALKARGLA